MILIDKATGVCVAESGKSFLLSPPLPSVLSLSLSKPNIVKTCSHCNNHISVPENLNEKFSRKGIKFSQSDNIPTVQLTVRNGSSLKLLVPDALVTSYKPKVYWKDDGFEEILYTIPAIGSGSTRTKGGISLVINDASEPGSKGSLTPAELTVKDVDSDAIDAPQLNRVAPVEYLI
nr:photosynthetic NDH subunit of subcomplex B 2, chloroplastic-like [Ziziphus jujuba var. spinosa]